MAEKPLVVVLGGGAVVNFMKSSPVQFFIFPQGPKIAHELADSGLFRVMLIDRRNYFENACGGVRVVVQPKFIDESKSAALF